MKNRPAADYWPLPLTVPLMPDETTTGFISRLAARNGFPNMYSFYRLFGIDRQKVNTGDFEALSVVARLSGANPEVLALRLFANHKYAFSFAGQPLPMGWCGVNVSKFCPRCVETDIVSHSHLSTVAAPYQRWFWRIAPLRECPDHGIELITLAEKKPKMVLDFTCCINRALIKREIEVLSGMSPEEI